MTEANDSATSNGQESKAVVEESQEDDSSSMYEGNDSENMSSKIPEAQRNGRPKRLANAYNYQYKYNSDDMQSEPIARRRTATAAKYAPRRNNEATASYKERKAENWRDRGESNETARTPQGKNPRKKYDFGILCSLSKKSHCYYIKKKRIL